jgi:hypothetical protein
MPGTDKALGVFADDLGNVVVEVAGEVEGVFWLGPIGEHDWHGREHLHRHVRMVAVAQAVLGRPRGALHRTEGLAVHQHRARALQRRPAIARIARTLTATTAR